MNDAFDAKSDSQHPRKKHRPIPAGRISSASAIVLAALFTATASVIAYSFLPAAFLFLGWTYLANNVLYSSYVKNCAIVDVLSIAVGFVLRVIAGCVAIQVEPSSWILVCTFSLAMFLGFGKRRMELDIVHRPEDFRRTFASYDGPKLNLLLGITSTMCLMSYMLYTLSPETVGLHSTRYLVYTVPFVAYGLFRYLFSVQDGGHDGPVDLFLTDPVFLLNCMLWLASVIVVLII